MLAAQREFYSRSFAEFIAAAWPHFDPAPFVPNWHIKVVADHLQAVAEGKIRRLLINVPPGTAKTSIVSVMYTAWLWTRDPSKRIISASHSLDLATDASKNARDLITSEWYQRLWPTKLKDDQNKKTAFQNAAGGSRASYAFTGITGRRGNVVICDDPHSVDSAESAAERRKTVGTFLRAIPSRLNDLEKDAIIVVMQRLHEEDVAGAILDRPELGYVHLCIPMEAEATPMAPTLIGWQDHRAPGELLFPTKFSAQSLAELKAGMGPYAYAGQYQQDPVPANDGFFVADWFDRYAPDDLPKALNFYMTSDHAPGGKGDYNVFRVWGVDQQRNVWLVDSFRKRCLMDEALGIVRSADGRVALAETGALPMIRKWKPYGWFPEQDGTWTAIKSFVMSAMRDTETYCRIEPLGLKGAGDKVGKAQAYQAMASMGMVHLPKGRVGDEALAEYVSFPVGKHDDQVDADGAIARVIAEAMPAYIPIVDKTQRIDDYDGREQEYAMTGSDLCW